jgi:hypothetical protein
MVNTTTIITVMIIWEYFIYIAAGAVVDVSYDARGGTSEDGGSSGSMQNQHIPATYALYRIQNDIIIRSGRRLLESCDQQQAYDCCKTRVIKFIVLVSRLLNKYEIPTISTNMD